MTSDEIDALAKRYGGKLLVVSGDLNRSRQTYILNTAGGPATLAIGVFPANAYGRTHEAYTLTLRFSAVERARKWFSESRWALDDFGVYTTILNDFGAVHERLDGLLQSSKGLRLPNSACSVIVLMAIAVSAIWFLASTMLSRLVQIG